MQCGHDVKDRPGLLIARLLVECRRSTGLTQEELAARSGLSTRAISDLERGRVHRPHQRTIEALATALGRPDALNLDLRAATGGPVRSAEPQPENIRYQLPREIADFVGRGSELAMLRDLIHARAHGSGRATSVVSLFGAPGVGKTTFAIHLGHRLAPHQPSSRIFLDLHGMEPDPVPPHDAVGHLLRALGVPEEEVPSHPGERLSLYRSLVRGQRILLILDNVASEAQVRPLLPSSPGSLVLITSRRALSGLESVFRVMLGVLPPADAVRLLDSILGAGRVAAEPQAAFRVAELCGYLPLALRIAGNRLASRPRSRIAAFARKLDDQQRRLATLTAGDLAVHGAFAVSYRQLDEVTKRVFRMLSLAPPSGASVELVSVLVDLPEDLVEDRLEELVDASIVSGGDGDGGYVLHDLMRLFAREQLALDEPAATVEAAVWRRDEWLRAAGTGVRA